MPERISCLQGSAPWVQGVVSWEPETGSWVSCSISWGPRSASWAPKKISLRPLSIFWVQGSVYWCYEVFTVCRVLIFGYYRCFWRIFVCQWTYLACQGVFLRFFASFPWCQEVFSVCQGANSWRTIHFLGDRQLTGYQGELHLSLNIFFLPGRFSLVSGGIHGCQGAFPRCQWDFIGFVGVFPSWQRIFPWCQEGVSWVLSKRKRICKGLVQGKFSRVQGSVSLLPGNIFQVPWSISWLPVVPQREHFLGKIYNGVFSDKMLN